MCQRWFGFITAPISSIWRKDFAQRLRWRMLWALVTHRHKGLRALFGIVRKPRAFFPPDDSAPQTNSGSIKMRNLVYWAVLVAMTVLLMEQGKSCFLSSEHLLSVRGVCHVVSRLLQGVCEPHSDTELTVKPVKPLFKGSDYSSAMVPTGLHRGCFKCIFKQLHQRIEV